MRKKKRSQFELSSSDFFKLSNGDQSVDIKPREWKKFEELGYVSKSRTSLESEVTPKGSKIIDEIIEEVGEFTSSKIISIILKGYAQKAVYRCDENSKEVDILIKSDNLIRKESEFVIWYVLTEKCKIFTEKVLKLLKAKMSSEPKVKEDCSELSN